MRLRDVVDGIQSNDPHAIIILAGDYNDEPFDRSLADHLMATRDRQFAATKSHLMYNPFWRYLSHPKYIEGPSCSTYPAGTYYHSNARDTRWRTFDQIIFSSSVLSGGPWELDEALTCVLHFPAYSEMVMNSNHQFDHLPVLGTIRKRQDA
jgi:hypothetical protein